jgi:exoribonuclease R
MEAVEKESQTAPAAEKASKIKKPAPFVSIDAEYTRDIDDAIAVDKVPEGIRIQVAIANASAHVPIGCAEDIEAQRVGATVYAARRVLHRMLPKRISERMGSLVEGENRKAVVFEIILSEQLCAP